MIVDARGISFGDAFMYLRKAVTRCDPGKEKCMVLIEEHDHEKYQLIKGFAEILIGCNVLTDRSNGFLKLILSKDSESIFNCCR